MSRLIVCSKSTTLEAHKPTTTTTTCACPNGPHVLTHVIALARNVPRLGTYIYIYISSYGLLLWLPKHSPTHLRQDHRTRSALEFPKKINKHTHTKCTWNNKGNWIFMLTRTVAFVAHGHEVVEHNDEFEGVFFFLVRNKINKFREFGAWRKFNRSNKCVHSALILLIFPDVKICIL